MVRSKKDLIEIILCSLIVPEILFIGQEMGGIDIVEDVFGRLGLLTVLAFLGFGLLAIRSKVQPAGLRIILQILLFPAMMLTVVGLIVVLASYFNNRSSSAAAVSAGSASSAAGSASSGSGSSGGYSGSSSGGYSGGYSGYSGGYSGSYSGSYGSSSGTYSSSSYSNSSSDSRSAFREQLEERRREEDFKSAQDAFNSASWQYSRYAAQGATQNAATQEHLMHQALGNMLKNKSSGGDKEAFERAQQKYNSASLQMSSYKKQGMTADALTHQHFMNQAMAEMIKNASPTANKEGFESAKRDYENASRRYSEYKKQGLEQDAARQQDYMNRAFAEMLKNK